MAQSRTAQRTLTTKDKTWRWLPSLPMAARWLRVLALSIVGALVFELVLPRAWKYAKAIPIDYSPAFVALVTWVTSFWLIFIVSEPVRIRAGQWRTVLRYPPTWFAIPLGLVLAAASESLPLGLRPQVTGPDWGHLYPVRPIALAVLLAVALRQLRWQRREARITADPHPVGASLTWERLQPWISAGERPLTSGEIDLFNHRPLALRVAHAAAAERRPVALLGRFGTGKSSILNVVRAEMRKLDSVVVVAEIDVWAVQKPADVPRLALTRIVAALDQYVDTIEFRALPVSYQRLAAAEPSGRLAEFLGRDGQSDPVTELERLPPVLDALDAQLVLIIEDVERAGEQFDTRHLARLLWALRGIDRCSFILAVDPDHTSLDFSKLCDSIERIPPVQVKHVAQLLTVAFGHWRTAYKYIDPHPKRRDGDKLRLESALMEGMMEYLQRTGRDTPIDALVALLRTPRELKHVLRRVDRVWDNLHGEVELDDLVIVSALRQTAEPLFEFLLADIDPARSEPDDMLPRTQSVKSDWDALVSRQQNGVAAQRLVDLMGIEQLTRQHVPNATTSPQGVHVAEPVDYFSRIVAEGLGPHELRDQKVLSHIDLYSSSREGPLVDRMLTASETDPKYQSVWENFQDRHPTGDLLDLMEVIVGRLLARDGAAAAEDHPALPALWRSISRRSLPSNFNEWLRELIKRAAPISLRLVNGLYHYWTGRDGILNPVDTQQLRTAIATTIRAVCKTPADLARILEPDRPWELGRFITQTGRAFGLPAFAEWREVFAPLVLDGARDYPNLMVPALANLAGDEQSSMTVAREGPPKFINPYRIDRVRLEAFLGARLNEGLEVLANYSGDNPYATRAVDEAKSWLQELAEPSRQGTVREIATGNAGRPGSAAAPSSPVGSALAVLLSAVAAIVRSRNGPRTKRSRSHDDAP